MLNLPWAWIGVRRTADGFALEQFNQLTGALERRPLSGPRVSLRVQCDFLTELATFSASEDGETFTPLGGEFTMIFQLKTFQGVRFALFGYHDAAARDAGAASESGRGFADFDAFTVDEPQPRGLMRPIPVGREITLTLHGGAGALGVKDGVLTAVPATDALSLSVSDVGLGRVTLRSSDGRAFVVTERGGRAQLELGASSAGEPAVFQWIENLYGDLTLLVVKTGRFVRIDPSDGVVRVDHPGPAPDRRDGSCFDWNAVESRPPTLP